MIDDVVEMVGFNDDYWDEVVVFTRFEVEKHVDRGYSLLRYVESYQPLGFERIYAELEKGGEKVIIFASPKDGIYVSRIPAQTKATASQRKQ